MAIAIMSAVWLRAGVSGGELLVLLALADFSNEHGVAYPAVATLAQRARLSRRRVQEVLRSLASQGLIADAGATAHGVRRYRVLVAELGCEIPAPSDDAEGMRPTSRGGEVSAPPGVRPTAPGDAAHRAKGCGPPHPIHHEPSGTPPPKTPSTGGGALHRIEGIDREAVRHAATRGDVIAVLAAFGCQVDTTRHGEWRREADGLTLAALVTILQLERRDLGPIRQPSGLRHARQRWQAMPDGDRRKCGRTACEFFGIPLPASKPPQSQVSEADSEPVIVLDDEDSSRSFSTSATTGSL